MEAGLRVRIGWRSFNRYNDNASHGETTTAVNVEPGSRLLDGCRSGAATVSGTVTGGTGTEIQMQQTERTCTDDHSCRHNHCDSECC